jgi:predicted Zn-dependent peptidase
MDTEAEVLNFIHVNLTSGMSSPLMSALRKDIGGIYSVSSDHVSWYNGVNYENITTYCDEEKVVKVIKTIIDTIEDLKTRPMNKSQLEKNKNKLVFMHLRSRYENSLDSFTDWYGSYAIRNRNLVPVRTVYKRLISLNDVQIMDAAQYAFPSSNILVSYASKRNHDKHIQGLFKVPLTFIQKKI